MKINQGRPCHSSNYSSRSGTKIQYIVIHYTAGNGDTAQNNCMYSSGANRGASAHYFVGEDGIYQSVPDNMRAWHCGGTSVYKHSSCRNANSIGIEMCSRQDSSGKYEYYITDKVVQQAIELTRYLMDKYNIPAENVLRHYDVWAKQCPAPFVTHPEQWENFKKQLTESEGLTMSQYEELKAEIAALKADKTDKQPPEMIYNYIDKNMPEWARDDVQWCVDSGIIEGTGEGLNLNGIKLWVLVVIRRSIKFVINYLLGGE